MAGVINPINGRPPEPLKLPTADQAGATKEDARTSFSDQLMGLVDSVNQLQHEAGEAQQALLAGEPVELHDVMIKAEQAGLAMDLLLEIRNRLLTAYNELMRMPV
jgi:flagellar hook-basal body complex protein FliE